MTMGRLKVSTCCRWPLLFLVLASSSIAQYDINRKIPEHVPWDQFQSFQSRPDIHAPKWNVTVYDSSRISEGYWFTSPYEQVGAVPPSPVWVGPQIYDNNGGLIWSALDKFETANTYDFHVVEVQGKRWMTLTSAYLESGFLLDEHYEIQRQWPIGTQGVSTNIHEFNMIENGTRALILHRNFTQAPQSLVDELGWTDGKCRCMAQSFEERDMTQDGWHSLFTWNTLDHIHLTESTHLRGKCNTWDFLHTNSMDKCPDGHYLLSGRHTDTIYKIDKDDGHIIWRLGGKTSDFEQDFRFSRQHHIRCRGQNSTHTTISFLDNAKGLDAQKSTHDHSRGVIIALEDTAEPFTAKLMVEASHPHNGYNVGRGDCHLLENGNIFMAWSDRCLQSEHDPNGELLMQAEMVPEWVRTYRAFKDIFKGMPTTKPDVVAKASEAPVGQGDLITDVYVSWNGATEVAFWRVYALNAKGNTRSIVATAPRAGFETHISLPGYAPRVVVEALDKDSEPLEFGMSDPLKTSVEKELLDSGLMDHPVSIADTGVDDPANVGAEQTEPSHANLWRFTGAGLVLCLVLLGMGWLCARWMKQGRVVRRYEAVRSDEEELDALPSQVKRSENKVFHDDVEDEQKVDDEEKAAIGQHRIA